MNNLELRKQYINKIVEKTKLEQPERIHAGTIMFDHCEKIAFSLFGSSGYRPETIKSWATSAFAIIRNSGEIYQWVFFIFIVYLRKEMFG